MRRFRPTRLGHLLAALAWLATASLAPLTLPGPARAGDAPGAQQVSLSLDQVRALARKAYADGNIQLANRLAWALWKANHEDVAALILLAATEPLLGRPERGRAAGRDAWKATDIRGLRHEAAFFTARAALFDKRFTATKYWLRRAWQTAGTEVQRQQTAYDFARVRAVSPWVGSFSASLAPSSNLNGGSQWDWLLIDDLFVVGKLSGAAQALSGWRAVFSGNLGYKIGRSENAETTLGIAGFHSFNFLSPAAQALAPSMRGSDLNNADVTLFLNHDRDATGSILPDHARLSFGHAWQAGAPSGFHAGLDLGRSFDWGTGGQHELTLGTEIRQDWNARFNPDTLRLALDADYSLRFANGARLHLGLGLSRTSGAFVNDNFHEAQLKLGYDFAKPVGPARISFNLGLRGREYPTYFVGPFRAPNGRTDLELSGSIEVQFEEFEYMGFTPVVSVSGAQTRSNITRFEGSDFGVSLGFRSLF